MKYLEGRLLTLLADAKKCELKNKTEPSFDRLPEADISDMESFLEELQLILPVIGVDFFRKPQVKLEQDRVLLEPRLRFTLQHPTKGIRATATEVDGEFVVLAGAIGSLTETVSFSEKMKSLRDQAFESGRAAKSSANVFTLLEDFAFSSPSAASVFLFGTSRNGRTDWMIEGENKTYGTWSDEKLSAIEE